jgi:deoxycytidylate deaminase
MIKKINLDDLRRKHPDNIKKSMHIAVIYKRGKIIAYGFNRVIMSKTELHHTNQLKAYWTKHAEQDALKKAGRRSNGAEMLVVRVMKDGSLGFSKPCFNCQFLIERAGIKLPVHHS